MIWENIALNPYGVLVQENEQGIRRFQSLGGWKVEENETIEVCRAKSNDEIVIASKAMSNITISQSYKHNAYICALIWLTPKGVRTKINENIIKKVESNSKGIAFKKIIENEIGKRVLFLWMNNTEWNNELPKWSYSINMRSPTLSRGIQIGVAKLIEKRFKDDLWLELGLIISSDSSTWILPPEKRKVYAKKIDENLLAPYAVQQSVMEKIEEDKPKNNDNKNSSGFSINKVLNLQGEEATRSLKISNIYTEKTNKKLLWLTERSIKNFGWDSLYSWRNWFKESGAEGIIVFENKTIEKNFKFYDFLETKGIERFEIKGKLEETNIVYIVSDEVKKINNVVSLSEWAGEQPKIDKKKKIIEEDEFGRVPYRALSKITQTVGMIPKRLEESIHEALLEIERKYGNVDSLISKLMGIKKKELSNYISSEQVDAIALFYDAFSRKQDALLADETGFGKGRILASLLKIGLRKGKTVIFITENSQLFSDFYRDITDVYGDGVNIIPTILHGKAKILNPKGELVAKMNYKTKPYEAMLANKNFNKGEDLLIFTTYSQMNKLNKDKSNIKVEWLKNRMKQNPNGCWLILDEGHNAAGKDSNINKNLAQLLPFSEGALFSSATFAKTEDNLAVFKNVINMEPWLYQLLGSAIENDTGELREIITTTMAKKGNFIRREHKPIKPPKINWVNMSESDQECLTNFANFWQKLHETVATKEALIGGFKGFAWAKIGGYLSRSVKEFSFLMKVDAHIEHFVSQLEKNIKPVLAIESTFESALRSVLENELEEINFYNEDDLDVVENDEEDEVEIKPKGKAKSKKVETKEKLKLNGLVVDHIPLWKERLALIADKSIELDLLKEECSDVNIIKQVENLRKETLAILEKLPDWDLMPLERILRTINSRGYTVGELSGRMFTYEKNQEGGFKFVSLEKPSRVELVNNFNNGNIDFLAITLAGCTGISVHAGEKFKDQRQRELVEGEIAVNSSKRIQFWGRVRRKDQVIEPIFNRLALPILSEKRTQAREDKKKQMLDAHVGMKQEIQNISWISPEGESIVEEWAFDRKYYAMQIGVFNAIEGNPIGRVDRALLRSIILPKEEQDGLLSRLERGLMLMNNVSKREKNIGEIKSSRKIRESWILGHPTRNSENPRDPLSLPRINFVERVYENTRKTDYNYMSNYIKENNKNEVDGDVVLDLWKKAWVYEASVKNILNKNYNDDIWRWLTKNIQNCKKGNTIKMIRPGENDLAKGVVLGFDYPESTGSIKGASAWALSQVAIKVWLVGEEEPMLIPLLRLFRDPTFQILKEKADLSWFKQPALPFVGVSVEGNPVLSSYWNKLWKMGKTILIDDEDEGPKWILTLPKLWDWKSAISLPKIALNINQIYQFLSVSKKDSYLTALTKGEHFITARNNEYRIKIEVDHETYKEAFSSWANPSNARLFKGLSYRNKDDKNRQCVSFYLEFSSVKRLFASMEKSGILWQIHGVSDDWYKESSAKIMDAAMREGEKILNPNKKEAVPQKNVKK